MSTAEDDAEIIEGVERGWSDRLKSAKNGNSETVYDPVRKTTAWMTVPESLWTEVEP